MKVLKQIQVVAFCALTSALFADVVAPDGEAVVVDVAAGSSVTETGPVMADPSSKGIEKTGGSTYTLPLSAIASRDGFKAQVREGTLTLADTGAEGVSVAAPECLQNAALWLDAGQNTIIENDVVTKWLDVREGENGTSYYSAGDHPTTPASPSTSTEGGKTWVDFGACGSSGKFFVLQNTARAAMKLTTVYHAFALMKISDSYGFVFGIGNGNNLTFHPKLTTGAIDGNTYWSPFSGGPALYSGRTYLDGALVDGTETAVKTGVQLLEWEAGNALAGIGTFFKDRNLSDRTGGGALGEVVVFTNRLSSAERMKVEEYLMQKWIGKGGSASYDVKVAAGATVVLDGLSQEDMDKTAVSGLGTVVKTGAGSVFRSDAGREAFDGAWRVDEGSVVFESGSTTLALASGDAVTAVQDDYGATTVSTGLGTAGSVSKTGGGALRIESLPDDVTSVSVSGGALALGVPVGKAAVASGDDDCATIQNAGFESWSSQQYITGEKSDREWMFSVEAGAAIYVLRNGATYQTTNINGYNAPEGVNTLGIKVASGYSGVGGWLSASVSFPVDGTYEFTCAAMGRPNFYGLPVEFALVNGSGTVTNRFAKLYSFVVQGYSKQRFVVPDVSAGEWTLLMTFRNNTANERWAIFDDLKFRLVTAVPGETVAAVPNGGFEYATLGDVDAFNAANTAEGWTFANPTGGAPDAGLATRGMVRGPNGNNFVTNLFNAASATYGNVQLAFFGAAGSATSDAFALPVGKWKLRCRAGRWGQDASINKWNGNAVKLNPTLSVTATVGGVAFNLGSLSVANGLFETFTFPVAIESDGSVDVILALRQTTANRTENVAGLLVDDLEFVRVDNLVENGNFEEVSGLNTDGGTNGGWTLAFNRGNGSNVAKAELVDPSNAVAWGRTRCEGTYALHIVDCGAASRTVAFPEAGVYRISFRARARADYSSSGEMPDMKYAGNRVKALLDGVEIYRSPAIGTTNFVAYSGLFRVAAAGTKTLAIQGCAASGDKNAFVDLLSIEKAAVADVPDIPKTAEIDVRLAEGEKLRLDYPGTLNLKSLCVNGKNLSREISAETRPDFISGPGSVYVVPNGLTITFR